MFRLRRVPSRALYAGAAVFSLVSVAAPCAPASPASASSGGATTTSLSVTWMPSYAAPDTLARYDKVGVLKISAGVAELRRDDTPADLFKRADQALYRAKNAGKARTVAQ